MLRQIPAVLALTLLATGAASAAGRSKTEDRPVGQFTAIDLTGAGRLVIEQSDTDRVSVTADDSQVGDFKTIVKDGVLHLSVESGKHPDVVPEYRVLVKSLRRLDVNGAAAVHATKIAGPDLSIVLAGAASGEISGQVERLTLSIGGAGSFDAGELKAKSAKATIGGVGQATVNASEQLDAEVSGTGVIWYLGAPKVDAKTSGAGIVRKKSS